MISSNDNKLTVPHFWRNKLEESKYIWILENLKYYQCTSLSNVGQQAKKTKGILWLMFEEARDWINNKKNEYYIALAL